MIETITYNDKKYPKFQAEGNAAQFIIPFANKVCMGKGYDIGCNRLNWMLPDIIALDTCKTIRSVTPIDPNIDGSDALNLPFDEADFIFSSHCLEHIDKPWFDVLEYWASNLKLGGTLFLYLPDYSQEYWRPWNNRKHHHIFTPEIMKDAFNSLKFKNIFVSGVDLMNSFAIMGEKTWMTK